MYFVEVMDREIGKFVVRFREEDEDTAFGIYFACCMEAQPYNKVFLIESLPVNELGIFVEKIISWYAK